MPISSHSHSGQFCSHATGTLRQVVSSAVSKGFHYYGLTEHQPRTRQCDIYPEELEAHLQPNDLSRIFQEFIVEARTVQKETKEMKILVGMETEWIHSDGAAEIQALRASVDYLVGSIHHINSIPIDFSPELFSKLQAQFTLDEIFDLYFDAQFDLLHIKPEVIGHFDLVRIWHPEAKFTALTHLKIRRNIELIVSYGGLVELNSRAFKKGLGGAYPLPDVLEVMIEMGARFTLSDDSHGPADVGMHYKKLLEYLLKYGITKVYFPGGVELEVDPHDNFWKSAH